jgi:hypothetical protein
MGKFKWAVIAVSFTFAFGVMCCFAQPAKAAGPLGISYDGNNYVSLTINYHMAVEPRAQCPGGWSALGPQIVDGPFPPGLALQGFKIIGTPTALGNWLVKLKFMNVSCSGVFYGDETVTVNLVVSPQPVQR